MYINKIKKAASLDTRHNEIEKIVKLNQVTVNNVFCWHHCFYRYFVKKHAKNKINKINGLEKNSKILD